MNEELTYQHTDDLLADSQRIIEAAQRAAYQSVDRILLLRNWFLGRRIAEENMDGTRTERYGAKIIADLSEQLSEKYGKGFDKRALYRFVKFYQIYPEIVDSALPQSKENEIVVTASPQSPDFPLTQAFHGPVLSWSHYCKLLQVSDSSARAWYAKEAYEQAWSVRTLQRNIDTQYYDRMLLTHDKWAVEAEMKQWTSPYQGKLEFIRNPVIAEFLGMQEDTSYLESDLEQAIISNLQRFLMELGKGYAFVARQQHIHTEKQDYYI